MKKILLWFVIASLSATAFAADESATKGEETKASERIQAAGTVLDEIQGASDQGIPEEVLGSAECVAVVPSMIKGGFIVGARFGRGVASCRTPKGWSAPAFFTVAGGSFGLQIGGQAVDLVMTPPQGIFVDYFKIPACTASGLARIALRTDAAVVPGFTIWDPVLRKYRLHFDPAVELVRTGNDETDIAANTQLFTKIIEDYVRRYPDQWLWVHRRWKTRPAGEPSLY